MKDGNALTCAICIDLVTDIDEFLTSDTTEDQIVQFVEQVHFYLFPLTLLGLRTICLKVRLKIIPMLLSSCARRLEQSFPTLRFLIIISTHFF